MAEGKSELDEHQRMLIEKHQPTTCSYSRELFGALAQACEVFYGRGDAQAALDRALPLLAAGSAGAVCGCCAPVPDRGWREERDGDLDAYQAAIDYPAAWTMDVPIGTAFQDLIRLAREARDDYEAALMVTRGQRMGITALERALRELRNALDDVYDRERGVMAPLSVVDLHASRQRLQSALGYADTLLA